MGNEWDALVPSPNTWRAAWRVLKPGAYCLTFAGCRTHDLVTLSLRLAGFRIEDQISWIQGQGMAKRRRLDLAIDTHLGAKDRRPVLGKHPRPAGNGSGTNAMGGGWQEAPDIHGAATPEASRHVGWDRGLHPRWEPVVVATKPMRGTVAETALAYACRVPRGDAGEHKGGGGGRNSNKVYGDNFGGGPVNIHPRGGYPTNVCMDDDVADALDAEIGPRDARGAKAVDPKPRDENRICYGKGITAGEPRYDKGGPSRFFYVPKASTSERDAGLDDLDVMTAGERSDREDGSSGINGYAGTRGEARNGHPCVKPIELMRRLVRDSLLRYLSRLASPPGAWHSDVRMRPLVLDPFCGSGSTLVASLREGVRVVGCEYSAKYAEYARRRCQHAYAMPRDDLATDARVSASTGQVMLF